MSIWSSIVLLLLTVALALKLGPSPPSLIQTPRDDLSVCSLVCFTPISCRSTAFVKCHLCMLRLSTPLGRSVVSSCQSAGARNAPLLPQPAASTALVWVCQWHDLDFWLLDYVCNAFPLQPRSLHLVRVLVGSSVLLPSVVTCRRLRQWFKWRSSRVLWLTWYIKVPFGLPFAQLLATSVRQAVGQNVICTLITCRKWVALQFDASMKWNRSAICLCIPNFCSCA